MSSKGGGKGGLKLPFGRSNSKKDKEHSDKHGASNSQRNNSISKGASGSSKQSSGSHDGDSSVQMKSLTPITVTSTATVSKPKILSPGGPKRVDPPSDKDLKHAFHSLTNDPQGRRDSKNELEHYKEQSRKFKSEIEDLKEQLENAQTRARVHNQTVAERQSLVSEKDKELIVVRKAQEDATEQLNALQRRYVSEKNKVEADKMKLEQSYKAKIADLQAELSAYNKNLLEAQEDDVSLSVQHEMEAKFKELEKKLEASSIALQEEKDRVQRRDKQLSKLDSTARDFSTRLEIVKAEKKEVENSKQALETKYQLIKEKKKDEISKLEGILTSQAAREEQMKAAIRESQSKHQQQLTRERTEKEDVMKQLPELRDKIIVLEQQIKQEQEEKEDLRLQLQQILNKKDVLEQQMKDKVQAAKEELDKLKNETKTKLKKLKEALSNKENVELKDHYDARQKDEQIKKLQEQLEEKAEQITMMENAVRKQAGASETDNLQKVLIDKENLEQEMKTGYKEREDRIAELEEFINDQVTELDKMEAAMKQTVASKEIAEKELNEALEKKQAELDVLKIAYEKKNEEIQQSLSHMSVDKEEMDRIRAKLQITEEQLLQATKEKEYSAPTSKDTIGNSIQIEKLIEEKTQLDKKCIKLLEEKKTLSKRCDELGKNCDKFRDMLQKNPEKELHVELCKKKMEITDLKKQIAELQGQCKAMQLSSAKASDEQALKADQELASSQESSDQVTELYQKVKLLENELDSTKSSMQQETEKVKALEAKILHLKSVNKESSSKDDADADTLRETTKRLAAENAYLNKQLKEQNKQDITVGKNGRDHSPYVQDDLDQLSREHEVFKQTQDNFYEGNQNLNDRYHQKEEVIRLQTQIDQLKNEFESQKLELSKANEELDRISSLNEVVQQQHEKLGVAERDRDIAAAVIDEKESGEKEQIELRAKLVEMRNNHLLVVNSKDAKIDSLEKRLRDKESELSELKAHEQDLEQKLAQKHDRNAQIAAQTATFDNVKDTELLQGYSRESTCPSPRNEASKDMVVVLKEKDQTIEQLSKQVEHLQKQQMKSSDDSGVGGPCVDVQSGGVGDVPNEEIHHADAKCQLTELQSKIKALTEELTVKESTVMSQQDKINKLTEELTVEKIATDSAKNEMDNLMGELQQLRSANKVLDQQMKDGYKEREDRIAELEEFINDQVTELDKMEAAMKQTVANKQILEKDHQKLTEYFNQAKNLVEQYEKRHIAQEKAISMGKQREENANEAIAKLEQEKEALTKANQNLSREVARLMSVDVELQTKLKDIEKYKEKLRKAEEELQTKEYVLNTYKEDFEAERKDRENAHNIKEIEITKVRVEMEEFEAQCQEKVKNIKQSLEAKMNTLEEQISHLTIDRDKFKKESEKLRAELDKEKKDAQSKIDLYKKKTEQFQLQWKKREEAEVKLNTLAEQLNNQHELNRQLNSTIDTLMRKNKGIEPQIPSNNIATQLSSQQRRMSPRDPPFSSMATPADTLSNQYHAPSTVSSSDPSLAHTNAEMGFHQRPPPSSTSQPSWQRQQEQQYHYKMQQQQHEEHLHLRGQGRGAIRNQPLKPQHEATYYPSDYQGQGTKYIPPANIDNYQPKSMQPHTEHNVAGTNAAPMQFPQDDYSHGRSSGPASLDSSITTKPRPPPGYANPSPLNQSPLTGARRPEKPTQYASEGINEEIRYQANKQRRYQEYERFDSNLQLDPYLICPKCKLQFREGQLPEYRHHIDNCHQ